MKIGWLLVDQYKAKSNVYLNVEHLLVHLFHGHSASEHGGHGEVAAVPGVAGRHHVAGVEHLLGQLGNRQRPEQRRVQTI